MAPSLITLPAEIILHISGAIGDKKRVLKLALCSRRLYEVLSSQLYPSVKLSTSPRQASGMLRAALLNQDLAYGVRELDVSLSDQDSVKRWEKSDISDQPLPYPIDRVLLLQAVENASHSEKERQLWLSDLEMGKPDAYIGLLLVLLPGLRKLTIRSMGDEIYCSRILERAAKGEKPFAASIPSFPLLTSVKIFGLGLSRYFKSKDFITYLRLPEVHDMSVTPVYDDDEPWPIHENSTITDLTISGQTCINGLHSFLPSLKSLKSLEYTHCYPGAPSSFSPARLYDSLLAVKDTLEHLTFRSYERSATLSAHVGSFADFRVLKSLTIKLQFIVCGNPEVQIRTILPPSLETLSIERVGRERRQWMLNQFDLWAENWELYTPLLRLLAIESSDNVSEIQNYEIRRHCDGWNERTKGQLNIIWEMYVYRGS